LSNGLELPLVARAGHGNLDHGSLCRDQRDDGFLSLLGERLDGVDPILDVAENLVVIGVLEQLHVHRAAALHGIGSDALDPL
jgi:hypothetical protein